MSLTRLANKLEEIKVFSALDPIELEDFGVENGQVVARIVHKTFQQVDSAMETVIRETMAHMLRCFVADWARIIKYVVIAPDGKVIACCERPTRTQNDWDFSTAFYTDEIDMAPYLPVDMWQESLIQLEDV